MNEEARAKALASGLSPLEYMLDVLRSEEETPERRLDAAKAAAPYVHARLSSVTVQGEQDRPIVHEVRWVMVSAEVEKP